MLPTIDLRSEAKRVGLPQVPQKPHLKDAAIETWRARMVNEYSSSYVFASLAKQMEAAGFSKDQVAACLEFSAEEKRHGVLCASVVEALGGEAIAPHLDQDEYPEHEEVSRKEAVLRNLLSISCLSETIAVSLIAAERLEMPEGELRDRLTELWADEIGHARFGWSVVAENVPSLTESQKRNLEEYLSVALAHVEAHELAHLPASNAVHPDGNTLGLCSGSDARVLLYETIEEVIVPRLQELGLNARKAWDNRASRAI